MRKSAATRQPTFAQLLKEEKTRLADMLAKHQPLHPQLTTLDDDWRCLVLLGVDFVFTAAQNGLLTNVPEVEDASMLDILSASAACSITNGMTKEEAAALLDVCKTCQPASYEQAAKEVLEEFGTEGLEQAILSILLSWFIAEQIEHGVAHRREAIKGAAD